MARAAPQRVGYQPDQLYDGRVERDGDQRPAAVPGQRARRDDEHHRVDRRRCRGHGQPAQGILGLVIGPAAAAQVAGCGRLWPFSTGQAAVLLGRFLVGRGRGALGGSLWQGYSHRAARCTDCGFGRLQEPWAGLWRTTRC